MQESCGKVGAFGVEDALLLSLFYHAAEKCNLLCVETFPYVLYNENVVGVKATVAAYDAACRLQADEYQFYNLLVRGKV